MAQEAEGVVSIGTKGVIDAMAEAWAEKMAQETEGVLLIGKKDVVDAVANMLCAKWPSWNIYRNRCPTEPTRPAFLLEVPQTSRQNINSHVIGETVTLAVSCLERQDEQGNSDADALAQVQQEVIELFRAGYFRVADRAVKCKATGGKIDSDRALIELQCSYWEQRSEDSTLPLMREIHSKLSV